MTALLDIVDALARNQDESDALVEQSRKRVEHSDLGRAIEISHRLINVREDQTKLTIPGYGTRHRHRPDTSAER